MRRTEAAEPNRYALRCSGLRPIPTLPSTGPSPGPASMHIQSTTITTEAAGEGAPCGADTGRLETMANVNGRRIGIFDVSRASPAGPGPMAQQQQQRQGWPTAVIIPTGGRLPDILCPFPR